MHLPNISPFPDKTVYKIPESVLVVIYTEALDVLLIRRADVDTAEFWQSVTGSKDEINESFLDTAIREVWEETGIDAQYLNGRLQDWQLQNIYEIYPQWRHRYAPEVSHNTESLFGLCIPAGTPIRLNPREHTAYQWLPYREAADLCFSPSNAEACLQLSRFALCQN